MTPGLPTVSVAEALAEKIVALTPDALIEERQPHLRGRRAGALDPAGGDRQIPAQCRALAFKLMAFLYGGRIDLSPLRA